VARRERLDDPQLRTPATAPAAGHRPWNRSARKFDQYRRRSAAKSRRHVMGKYLVGWLLGVPVFVLVILYFFFH
jgi:hypothetical protein